MQLYDTYTPYEEVPYQGLQYSVCVDYNHISRYKGLRQLIHNPNYIDSRFVSLETPNALQSNINVRFYEVPFSEENRLDLIANKFLGDSTYAWIIAYINEIDDGFTVRAGQRIKIPVSFYDLFNSGELLAAIPALQLNLLTE